MTTSGSSEAISLVLMALLRPADEVIVVQPEYHLLVELAAALGCNIKTWRLVQHHFIGTAYRDA